MDHVHLKLHYGHVMWLFYPFVSLLFILCVGVFARVYAYVPDMFLVPSVTRRRWEVPCNWSHRLLSWEPSSDPQQLQQVLSLGSRTKILLEGNDVFSFGWWTFVMQSDKPVHFSFGHNIPICCIWLEGCTSFGSYAQAMIYGRHGWWSWQGAGYFPQTIFPGDFQLTSNWKGQCLSLYNLETSEQWANTPL